MAVDVFSAKKLEGEIRLDPARTAVLIVDMLNEFCKPGGAMVLPGYETLVPPQRRLIEAARGVGCPILFIVDSHRANVRQDREFLLVSLVDPSSVIRKEFVSLVIHTRDGRVLTGLPVSRDESGVTLVNARNEATTIAMAEIDELQDSPVSIMPADLYRQLSPQELRDLFSYLQRRE